jgi:23S rRNA pseudouridine955/2504/2580 synthase/23S rRNA pseudouridine1911/1915/1917 synthase
MPRLKALEILYEDAHLIAVNKPSGLLSIPGREIDENSVLRQLQQRHAELFIVHRLDRDTSGVLIFAKDAESHRILSAQFSSRQVKKTYLALVRGRPVEQSFSINLKLIVDANGKTQVSKTGKVSSTHCTVLELYSRYALLEVHPVTGRQHQIRVHLAQIGHALAVDQDYGSPKPLTIKDIKPGFRHSGDIMEPQPSLMARTPLHAQSIEFQHPKDGRVMILHAGMPKDMKAVLTQLRKWSR